MTLQVLRWHRNKKKIFLCIFCSFLILYLGLENSSHINSYHGQLLQNRVKFNDIKEILEIEPKERSASLRSNVINIRNITPEVKPRIIQTAERSLFQMDNWRVIEKLKKVNWKKWEDKYCSGHIYNFDGSFVLMTDVILDPSKKSSKSKGGEDIKSAIGQTERDEEVSVKRGFFNLPCKKQPKIYFPKHSFFKKWLSGILIDVRRQNNFTKEYSFTVMIKRGDYANLYWTLIEIYNTYLTVRLFDENPKIANIILMDAHPASKLDNMWKIVFGNVQRIGQMEGKSLHKKLAWVTPDGPMPLGTKNVPFINDFKQAIYKRVFNSPSLYHECTNNTRVKNATFILRKDYLAHPRNPKGKVKRKLSNEKELMKYLTKRLPDVTINAIQIDLLPIEEQIRVIYNTKILIGVHGAGLGHTLLLRSGSTMIELFPSSYKLSPNPHFQMFAYWADVHYDRWYSTGLAHHNNEWVYVDPEATYKLLKHAINRSCAH